MASSVTSVLSHDMNESKRAAINFYKDGPEGWAARGTALHKVLENKLLNKPITEDEKWQRWIDPLVNFEIFDGAEVLAVEYSICDPIRSIGGSFDFLIKTKFGETLLGDLKTSSSKKAAQRREPANAQLGAYTLMLNKHHPSLVIDNCCTVILGPDICRIEKEKPDNCVEMWQDTWIKYQLTQEDW